MKKAVFLAFSFLFLVSCNDDKKSTSPGEPVMDTEDSIERDFTMDDIDEDRDNVETGNETVNTIQTPADHEFTGNYRKVNGEESGPCDCDCLEVNLTSPSQLCISPDKMYISAKFVKTSGTTADVFLVEPGNVENAENELPWEEFDTETPIATIDLQPNGSMVLDWKGFHIDGELATDYAIYGKKTLEGTYKKQ
ncbi:hypothetical protein GCM10007103_29370 [Salinimicrobium marinum]|uniref:Lipoprotein n=1 Tax=Salinimicrobium marinum TaxID=680283 RepID=A0A918SJJ9_9FLAO|nr:hypothetical protein [Salinimicrobium marinum]GHA46389.1 hypothetical protein GCM10007103_29370 [Salinimicrobium marinum]